MNFDIGKLQGFTELKIKFPSRNKANKFIRGLVHEHDYKIAEPWLEGIKNVGKDGVCLLIFEKSLLPSIECNGGITPVDYTNFIIPDVKVKLSVLPKADCIIKGLPFINGSIHYLTKNINDSELALRYYIDFYCRPTYVGKWFIKCKETKKYLEITAEQAKIVNDTMTKGNFSRVVGFREYKGFKRIIIKGNDLNVTFNDKLCMIQPISIKDIDEQERS